MVTPASRRRRLERGQPDHQRRAAPDPPGHAAGRPRGHSSNAAGTAVHLRRCADLQRHGRAALHLHRGADLRHHDAPIPGVTSALHDAPISGATSGPHPIDPDGATNAPHSPARPWSHPDSSGPAPDRYGLEPAGAYGFDTAIARSPRIEPSPPANHNRLVLGIVVGLVAGAILFGTAGWFAGRSTARETAAPAPAPSAPAPAPSLGVYEQSQVAVNQPKLTGNLTTLAQGWLPYLSSCDRNGEPGGPALNRRERVRASAAGSTGSA